MGTLLLPFIFAAIAASGGSEDAVVHDTEIDGALTGAKYGPVREWIPNDTDGSVHCLGNGRLCVYGQGPDVIQIFGPPYSTTNIGRITLQQPGAVARSRRVLGTAIWEHRIDLDGREVAVITDFIDSELPSFVRHVRSSVPLEFAFHPEAGVRMAQNTAMMQEAGAKDGLLLETPIGKPSVPFGNYPIPFAFFHQLAWRGAVEATLSQTADTATFKFAPGEGILFISGGPGLAECMDHMKETLSAAPVALLGRTAAWWADFTAKGKNFEAELPADLPLRARLIQILDDAAVLIKAQQAAEGGVLAGYPYHLGYVRDQYGTHRGLVALGHEEMSRDILDFYFGVFEASGQIHNAQAFGIPGLFHVHENDEVEITGYITMQAFDYLERSGNAAFVKRIFPLLEWAWNVQQRHFIKDMLPFNGDETYVAGGLLPRSTLNDGSAEATMLFIESGRLLLDFAGQQGLWDPARIEKERQCLNRVRESYRENFWRGEQLITNNPERSRDSQLLPRTRHGVCEACSTVQWTLRTENDRYLCLNCLPKVSLPRAEPKVYTLPSVSLVPLYFHSRLFRKEELSGQIEEILGTFAETETPSSPGDKRVFVGYDYGLLLYALTELNHPMARALYERTVALADTTGAWAEYYRGTKPSGTRCRPWESAINIEALLHWIEKEYDGRQIASLRKPPQAPPDDDGFRQIPLFVKNGFPLTP